MGVHTGDSITVAPAQTLTDREYQILRDLAHRVLTAVGVETGGSNVQFGVDPKTGRVVVIEMNPRVSRSSALASKATGFPIAKLAALVAVGYTLNEIPNDITRQTKAAFEPSLDYVVVKIPRWAFEKFPGVDPTLGPQMKSVGEVMALGRTLPEALNKAIQSLEIGVDALDGSGPGRDAPAEPETLSTLRLPTADRLFRVYRAIRQRIALDEITGATWLRFMVPRANAGDCDLRIGTQELQTGERINPFCICQALGLPIKPARFWLHLSLRNHPRNTQHLFYHSKVKCP